MPHKRNPVLSENLSGLSRLLRGYAVTAMENVALWHERDISHSSAERVIAPDATIVLHFALGRFKGMMEKLVLYPDRMRKNLESTNGLLFSQRVLLALAAKGYSREKAYEVVQRSAMKSWKTGRQLRSLLWKDREVRSVLAKEEFDDLFDIGYYVKNIDGIIDRVFGTKCRGRDGVKAKIYVTLKKGVLDPQGRAILSSLSHLGIAEAWRTSGSGSIWSSS